MFDKLEQQETDCQNDNCNFHPGFLNQHSGGLRPAQLSMRRKSPTMYANDKRISVSTGVILSITWPGGLGFHKRIKVENFTPAIRRDHAKPADTVVL